MIAEAAKRSTIDHMNFSIGLLRSGMQFEWSPPRREAFVSLKEKLVFAPVLAYPNLPKVLRGD